MDTLDGVVMKRRDFYLDLLLPLASNNNVTFVVGVRRSGKSCLAIQLEDELRERYDRVMRYNFETVRDSQITSEALISNFKKNHVEGETCYILLDEVMHIDDWKAAVEFFTKNSGCKLFIFSSNRCVISNDLTAVKQNEYDLIEMLPLSLSEFILFQNFSEISSENTPLLEKQYSRFGDKEYTISEIFKFYITFGGLPVLKPEYMNIDRARVVIDGSYGAIVTRDILEISGENGLHTVTDPVLLRNVISILAESIGNNLSSLQISKQTINSLKRPAAAKTVDSYIRALLNAHFFYAAERYDIRSGQMLKTMSKYYMIDAGLHSYVVGVRPEDESCLLESKVFFELLRRGYRVCNGKFGQKEIHFVAFDKIGRIYVQVVNSEGEGSRNDALLLLRAINDNHPKVVITLNGNNEITDDGIIVINALDFLMGHPLGR